MKEATFLPAASNGVGVVVLLAVNEGLVLQEMKEVLRSDSRVLLVAELLSFVPAGKGEERCSDRSVGLLIGMNWLLLGVEEDDMLY